MYFCNYDKSSGLVVPVSLHKTGDWRLCISEGNYSVFYYFQQNTICLLSSLGFVMFCRSFNGEISKI